LGNGCTLPAGFAANGESVEGEGMVALSGGPGDVCQAATPTPTAPPTNTLVPTATPTFTPSPTFTASPGPLDCERQDDPDYAAYSYCLYGIDIDSATIQYNNDVYGSIACQSIIVNGNASSAETIEQRDMCEYLRTVSVQLIVDHDSGPYIIPINGQQPQWNVVKVREVYEGVQQLANRLGSLLFIHYFPAIQDDGRGGFGYVNFILSTTEPSDSAAVTYANTSMIYLIENGEGLGNCSPPACDKTITRYLVTHELLHILESRTTGRFAEELDQALGDLSKAVIAHRFYPDAYQLHDGGFNNGDSPSEEGVEMLNIWVWHNVLRDPDVPSEDYWGTLPSTTVGFIDLSYVQYIDGCLFSTWIYSVNCTPF
jgi:hypothetical protein